MSSLKNYLFLLALSSSLQVFAQANNETDQMEQQRQINYKIACLSDAELTADQELISLLGKNPTATLVREDFQLFASSPGVLIAKKMNDYDKIKSQLIEQMKQSTAPEVIEKAAAEYAKEKNVSVEEAKIFLLNSQAEAMILQQTGETKDSSIFTASDKGCGFIEYVKPEIEKLGCKTSSGEKVDFSVSEEFCSSISQQRSAFAKASTQLQAINQKAQFVIQSVTEALQKNAQTEMAPLLEEIKNPVNEVVAIAMKLVDKDSSNKDTSSSSAQDKSITAPELK